MGGPEVSTRYTRVDGSGVGYSASGDGLPLLFMPASSSHIDLMVQHEPLRLFLASLGESAQVIRFDHRGFGVSDEFDGSDDEWPDASVADAVAVLDALEVEQADVLVWDLGAAALRLGATHPERVRRIVMLNSCARLLQAPDYPFGPPPTWLPLALDSIDRDWGTGAAFTAMEPWVEMHQRSRTSGAGGSAQREVRPASGARSAAMPGSTPGTLWPMLRSPR